MPLITAEQIAATLAAGAKAVPFAGVWNKVGSRYVNPDTGETISLRTFQNTYNRQATYGQSKAARSYEVVNKEGKVASVWDSKDMVYEKDVRAGNKVLVTVILEEVAKLPHDIAVWIVAHGVVDGYDNKQDTGYLSVLSNTRAETFRQPHVQKELSDNLARFSRIDTITINTKG